MINNLNNVNSSKQAYVSSEEKAHAIAKKSERIHNAIYRLQPKIDDFKKCDGYPNWMLEQDKKEVSRRSLRHAMESSGSMAASDRWSRDAEPILTYVLSSGILPTRECFSHLASDYDDLCNGTDIVFGVKTRDKSRFMVFSIDVATGTNNENIAGKFNKSEIARRNTSPFAANIKYCKHQDKRWREQEAPHFILGMMPARLDDAVDEIQISDEGIIAGREVNPDYKTDFRLLSELYEQIKMQKSILKKNPDDPSSKRRLSDLEDFQHAVISGLYRTLGIDTLPKEARREAFDIKYKEEVDKAAKKDSVYRNIIAETRRRTKRDLGQRTLKMATSSDALAQSTAE